MKQTKQKRPLSIEPLLIRLAILIGWALPRHWGYRLATFIGNLLGSLKRNKMVKAIRANQYIVQGQELSAEALDQLPKTIFVSSSKCLFDYFHFLPRPERLQKIVSFSPEAQHVFERIQNHEPTVVVCPHLSNFELMGYALALHKIDIQVLSFPNPNESYRIQNRLREQTGINVTPLDFSAFRQAQIRLQEGGSVLTGLDRPLTDDKDTKYMPRFFGYETHLPVAYIRMALKANAPVVILAAITLPDGSYRLVGSDPIWMTPNEDLETEILANSEKVLKIAEPIIAKHAQQWAMFYPIWPQFLGV